VTVYEPHRPLGQNHLRLNLPTRRGWTVDAIMWDGVENPPPLETPIELAVRLQWNVWKGRRKPRVEIVDWRVAETA
jgi:hypothetical protein